MQIIFANDIGSSLYPQGIAIGSILLGGENLELAMLMAIGGQVAVDYLIENDFSDEAIKNVRLTNISKNDPTPWQSSTGEIRGISSLSYNAFRDWTINGMQIREFRLDNGDRVALGNYLLCNGCSESEDRLYYLADGTTEWFQFAPVPSTYTAFAQWFYSLI